MININFHNYAGTGYSPLAGGFPALGGAPGFSPARPALGGPMSPGCGCPNAGGWSPSHELMQGGQNMMQGFMPLSGFGQDPMNGGLASMAGLGAMMGGMMGALQGLLPGSGGQNAQVPQVPQFGQKAKKLEKLLKAGKGKGKKAQKSQAAAFRQIRKLLTGPNGIL